MVQHCTLLRFKDTRILSKHYSKRVSTSTGRKTTTAVHCKLPHTFRTMIFPIYCWGKVADINAEGGRYGGVLGAACAAGHHKYVIDLLGREADPDVHGGILGSPLQAALYGGNREVYDALLGKVRINRSSSFWKKIYLRLRKEKEQMMSQFEDRLWSSCNVTQELTSDQRLVAAVIVKSPKKVASRYQPEIRSALAATHEEQRLGESFQRLVRLAMDVEAETDDLEQVDYMYNRPFWAGISLLIVRHDA